LPELALPGLAAEARARPLHAQGSSESCGTLGTLTAEQRNQFAFASVGGASSIPAIRASATTG
jgi:Flp pilus assembly protein TadD